MTDYKRMRKKRFVDPKVQGMLLRHAARYWFMALAVVGGVTVMGWVFISPGIGVLVQSRAHLGSLLSAMAVAVGVAVFLLPVALFDLIRVSSRFVGPMHRLRGLMQRAAAGERVGSIEFRDGDVWNEFADAFNALNKRLQSLEDELEAARPQEAKEAAEPTEPEPAPVG